MDLDSRVGCSLQLLSHTYFPTCNAQQLKDDATARLMRRTTAPGAAARRDDAVGWDRARKPRSAPAGAVRHTGLKLQPRARSSPGQRRQPPVNGVANTTLQLPTAAVGLAPHTPVAAVANFRTCSTALSATSLHQRATASMPAASLGHSLAGWTATHGCAPHAGSPLPSSATAHTAAAVRSKLLHSPQAAYDPVEGFRALSGAELHRLRPASAALIASSADVVRHFDPAIKPNAGVVQTAGRGPKRIMHRRSHKRVAQARATGTPRHKSKPAVLPTSKPASHPVRVFQTSRSVRWGHHHGSLPYARHDAALESPIALQIK